MMRIFGLEIRRAQKEKSLSPVSGWRQGWRVISEPFTGAWQRNESEAQGDVLCYPTLYACLNRIASDIGKLPFLLKRENDDRIWERVDNPAYSPVLRKPNKFQTAQQFREAWLLSKLIHGNTYALKQRDNRGVVIALYVLDPARVMPMVSESGAVFYQVQYDSAQNMLPQEYSIEQLVIPASEIIHDRMNCFHHQLIGVPPVCAANWPTVKNLRILRSASEFFGNNAQPGGILTAPAGLSDEDSEAIKEYWAENYSGKNSGRIAVIGADMKFTPFAMKSADSQLVEQMRYSDEQVCQPFGIPPFKVGIGSIPAGLGVDAINQLYYSDALQGHIEAMENLLDEGLRIEHPLGVELDLWPLLRMDVGKQADVMTKLTGGGIATPNEGRREFGYAPLEGGDTVYMQQQDFPLDQVRKNKIVEQPAQPDPEPEEPDEELEAANDEIRRLTAQLWQKSALESTRKAMSDA